jgi:hypothetical protein
MAFGREEGYPLKTTVGRYVFAMNDIASLMYYV